MSQNGLYNKCPHSSQNKIIIHFAVAAHEYTNVAGEHFLADDSKIYVQKNKVLTHILIAEKNVQHFSEHFLPLCWCYDSNLCGPTFSPPWLTIHLSTWTPPRIPQRTLHHHLVAYRLLLLFRYGASLGGTL